ncbi:MAG: hypothetical protein JWP97_3771 [Labilithrix sp.]|nr:hypothetical protein [Labilithrix sp.]
MTGWLRAGLAVLAVLGGAFACTRQDEATTFPVTPAPPSRHDALREALTEDARSLSFRDGDWLEDLGDAPFYGLAWLARRNQDGPLTGDDALRLQAAHARARTLLAAGLLDGDLQEKVMGALGLIEAIAAAGDRADPADRAALDELLARLDGLVSSLGDYLGGVSDASWAVRTYGPTAVTALVALVHAQYALSLQGDLVAGHLDRAVALEQRITDVALADLADAPSGRSVRGYAIGPGSAALDLYPNVAMMLLEARLFRLTGKDLYKLQARSIYAAIQPLKLSDVPARYASPYAASSVGATTANVATLSSQNYLALALMVVFEVTGDRSFIDEADRVLDAIETMRGPWCLAEVHRSETCAPVCASGSACVGDACTADRCTTGLLHHVVDGRLANATDPVVFCSGCNLQTLYVLGYRRALAAQPF